MKPWMLEVSRRNCLPQTRDRMHVENVTKNMPMHLQGQKQEFLHKGKWEGLNISPEFLECLIGGIN